MCDHDKSIMEMVFSTKRLTMTFFFNALCVIATINKENFPLGKHYIHLRNKTKTEFSLLRAIR